MLRQSDLTKVLSRSPVRNKDLSIFPADFSKFQPEPRYCGIRLKQKHLFSDPFLSLIANKRLLATDWQ